MDYLQRCIDLRRQYIEPEMFVMALAVRYIRGLINHGGSDMGRPDLESALHPEHLESFLARAVEITRKDTRLAQEWRKLQQLLPQGREAWEKDKGFSKKRSSEQKAIRKAWSTSR
jgi:hypothetical protein